MLLLFSLARFLNGLVDYFFYAVWVAVAAGVALSALLFAMGKPKEGGRFLVGTIAAAFVLSFGWIILTSAFRASSNSFPGASDITLLAYAGAALSVGASALYLLLGHIEKAVGYFAVAALILLAFNFGPAWFGATGLPGTTYGYMELTASPAAGKAPLLVEVTGGVFPPNFSGSVSLSWGDGSTTNLGSSASFSAAHIYQANGTYTIVATDSGAGGSISGSAVVTVYNSASPPAAGAFGWIVAGFLGFVSAILPALTWIQGVLNAPFSFFVQMPTVGHTTGYGSGMGDALAAMYSYTEGAALGLVGIFLVSDILWTLWTEGAEDLTGAVIGLSKELMLVVAIILTLPYFYNAFAVMVNTIGVHLVDYGDPGLLLAADLPIIILGASVGYFVPYLANLAADITFALLVTIALAVLRFVLIGALFVAAPILAVLWLFPPFRKVISFVFEIEVGLAISGLIAGAVLALIGKVAYADPSGISLAVLLGSPVFFALLPFFVSFELTGGGAGFGGLVRRARGESLQAGMGGFFGAGGGGSGQGAGTGGGGGTSAPVAAGSTAATGAQAAYSARASAPYSSALGATVGYTRLVQPGSSARAYTGLHQAFTSAGRERFAGSDVTIAGRSPGLGWKPGSPRAVKSVSSAQFSPSAGVWERTTIGKAGASVKTVPQVMWNNVLSLGPHYAQRAGEHLHTMLGYNPFGHTRLSAFGAQKVTKSQEFKKLNR